jgi:predicted NBD/HSP70 family sugar kinase
VLKGRGCRPLGVGVGVPGPVDARDGCLRFAPNIGWHDVELVRLLREKLDLAGCSQLRVIVLNDANAAALAHYVFGKDPHGSPLVYLTLGIGLGAGIVLGDRLYLGNDGMAGEVGHTILVPDGPECTCGRRGCAEMFISQRAVSRAITGEDTILTIDDLVERVARKDEAAVRAAVRAGDFLGLLIQNLCNTLNPAIITLGGPLSQFGETLLEASLTGMRTRGGRYDSDQVSVRLCRFGLNACAVGAAASVFHELLKPGEGGKGDGVRTPRGRHPPRLAGARSFL